MAGFISEYYGYLAGDKSPAALSAASLEECPFINDVCTKTLGRSGTEVTSGACAIEQMSGLEVICCPNRYYEDNFYFLSHVAELAFKSRDPIMEGRKAVDFAVENNCHTIAAFGKTFGGELRLPKRDSAGSYFVDWILARINPDGTLEQFCAIEVQTIDTTGNYHASKDGLDSEDRIKVKSSVGLNWSNVEKRIIPQLAYKGDILSSENRCLSGLFFVCPMPVLDKIMSRLGGRSALKKGPTQPAAITFVALDYDPDEAPMDGRPRQLKILETHTTTTSRMKEAFSNVSLPEDNVYEDAIKRALGL